MNYVLKFDLEIMDNRNRNRTIKHYSIRLGRRDEDTAYSVAADRLVSVGQELIIAGYSIMYVTKFSLEEVSDE